MRGQYGSVFDVDATGQLGAKTLAAASPFVHETKRKRLNFLPGIICLFIPWCVFVTELYVLSFSVHYKQPLLCWSVVFLGLLASSVCGIYAWEQHRHSKASTDAGRGPSWLLFLFASMVLAWVLAVCAGLVNFSANLQRYYSMADLNAYHDVDPARVRGQQLMDAGVVTFAEGTKLEVGRSMGFRSSEMYCVAPISLGSNSSTQMATYDYWAVGMGCCSGYQADFHCAGFNDPHARGGLRLMNDDVRPYFRLAVQQAEATYKIKAAHPLFFSWVLDAPAEVETWRETGNRFFLAGVWSHFLLQAFAVAAAGFYFAKLGHLS